MEWTIKFSYIALMCSVFCFTWSTQDKLHLHIPAPIVKELRQHAEVCSKETGVPASHLRKVIDKTLPNDRPNKEFFQCSGLASGFVDKDGHFVVDKMLTLQIMNGTKEELMNTLNECNKIKMEDNAETIFATSTCVHDQYIVTA